MLQLHSLPMVLAVGGHDPSGGAGIQADIEAIAANGGQALTVVTALTTQDTCCLRRLLPQPPVQVLEQCRLLFGETQVAAVKFGLLGSAVTAGALAGLLSAHPGLPAVLDPVLSSGSGTALADRALRAMLVRTLAPRCVLLTPNAPEARALAERQDLGDCAAFLTQQGCPAVLITGTHEPDAQVLHRLYGPDGLLWEGAWERLPGSFHGSGCTLASAAATGLAQGKDLQTAVQDALSYTWNSLQQALTTGRCQFTPNRLYRCRTYAD